MILFEDYILLPAVTGFFIQLLNLLEVLKLEKSRRPNFRDWVYWIPFIIAPIMSGFVGYLSFSDDPSIYKTMIGAQVGASAPLLLKGLAKLI